MEVPSKLDHLKMIASITDSSRRDSAEKLDPHKDELRILGIALSTMYLVATCHRKCFGGPHFLERLTAQSYNLACSAYILMCRGFYDESLNLIRSMGETGNLIAMSVVDKPAYQRWLSADASTRIKEFAPANVRKIIEKKEQPLIFARKHWYQRFCEDYTHVHPDTTLHHSEETGRSVVGGTVDEERMKEVIGELTGVSSHIAMIVSRFADLDDMLDELSSEVDRVSEPNDAGSV